MHAVSLFYYENQQKMLLKVLYLKSINNEILQIMSFFLAGYSFQ